MATLLEHGMPASYVKEAVKRPLVIRRAAGASGEHDGVACRIADYLNTED